MMQGEPGAGSHTLVIPLLNGYAAWFGGQNYIYNMLRCLARLPADRTPRVFIYDDGDGAWPDALLACLRFSFVEAVIGTGGKLLYARDARLEAAITALPLADRRKVIVGWSTAVVPMPFAIHHMVTTPKHWGWIPDFQHKLLPHMFDAEEIAARDAAFTALTDRNGPLLLSSEAARADLLTFYPGVRARTYVWRFASTLMPEDSADPAQVRAKYDLPQRFFLNPNQFWKHKDHRTLFRALARLKAAGRPLHVVATGSGHDARDPGYYDQLMAEAAALGITDLFRHVGPVPHADLIALMRTCMAIVQPSQFEGWSTVVEDARALGCPLVASDLPVHREQLDGWGTLFRTGDDGALADAMLRAADEIDVQTRMAGEATAARRAVSHQRATAEALMDCLDRERRAASGQ
ncbi:MAG TPA: glycosyltransferase family 1 protein [Azospirillaceae bacterium]|nr:glycosyltransferase family 1 protein [Azospirillaceae bacterium]